MADANGRNPCDSNTGMHSNSDDIKRNNDKIGRDPARSLPLHHQLNHDRRGEFDNITQQTQFIEAVQYLKEISHLLKKTSSNENHHDKETQNPRVGERGNDADRISTGSSTNASPDGSDEFTPWFFDLERETTRLDGLETYSVVSALTSGTLYQGFDAFQPRRLFKNVEGFAALSILDITDGLFYLSSSVGIIAGLHATLIFSLITVYGRTAIGMSHDEAQRKFMEETARARFRGFESFLLSIYAFLVQVLITIASKSPPKLRSLCFCGLLYSMYVIYYDTTTILKSAKKIFVPVTGIQSSPTAGKQSHVPSNTCYPNKSELKSKKR